MIEGDGAKYFVDGNTVRGQGQIDLLEGSMAPILPKEAALKGDRGFLTARPFVGIQEHLARVTKSLAIDVGAGQIALIAIDDVRPHQTNPEPIRRFYVDHDAMREKTPKLRRVNISAGR